MRDFKFKTNDIIISDKWKGMGAKLIIDTHIFPDGSPGYHYVNASVTFDLATGDKVLDMVPGYLGAEFLETDFRLVHRDE